MVLNSCKDLANQYKLIKNFFLTSKICYLSNILFEKGSNSSSFSKEDLPILLNKYDLLNNNLINTIQSTSIE